MWCIHGIVLTMVFAAVIGVLLFAQIGCQSAPYDADAGRVRNENGKTWIQGVAGFSPDKYVSSPHGCQAQVLQLLGEPLTYDDLICYSGFAFRVGIEKNFCPSAGHPCCGYTCMAGSDRALPWSRQTFSALPWEKPPEDRAAFEAEAYAAIKASIDRGIPVQYVAEEDGLIIGYADDGKRWWCVHPYYEGGREPFWFDEAGGFAGCDGKWPWGIVVWGKPKPAGEQAGTRELTIAALRQAVEMWRTEKRGNYYCGNAAYNHWVDWLAGIDAGQVADPKAGMQGNGWCFAVLIDSRRIAGPWLKAHADLFDGDVRNQLRIAGDHYTQLAADCMKGLNASWDLAPGPGRADSWTAAMRADQLTRLASARDHDAAAIAAIEQALAILDQPNP